jgi:hypothetical protein
MSGKRQNEKIKKEIFNKNYREKLNFSPRIKLSTILIIKPGEKHKK